MQFYHPEYLYLLLLLIPLLGLTLYRYIQKRKIWEQMVSPNLWSIVSPDRSFIRPIVRDLLVYIVLALLVIVIARPQMPGEVGKGDDSMGIEAMICIDVSNSMLSSDVSPSRMAVTKRMVTQLLSKMTNDRVGIVVFAGEAYIQVPITTDIKTVQEFLDDVSPKMISAQGTAIGDAIELAKQSFSERKDIGKSIIVFTDGEDHEGNTLEATKSAKSQGIRVDVVGIGSTEGGPIPIEGGYLKDEEGKMIITKLNPEVCTTIAEAGGGAFFHSSNADALISKLANQLDKLPKAAVNNIGRSGYIEKYELWAKIALIFLLLELFILPRRNRFFAKYNIFGNEK